MNYQVLARKWRPKTFNELIGQEHVVTVLVNALSQQRLHHAYLFTGTRGVGKTTIARIFAKSLNCQQGITAEPCGKCDVCLDIDQGRFVDLIEIDAASRTKVDDTREILDNVQYAPTQGRYKVYLIDEVHMLSRSSFNALLKTLEEPPEHVKFILATTDPQKLPVTVLSRCLQFHLKALTVSQIEQKLVEILAAEQVTHQDGSLTLLAKAARGSMRDSLSLTDQAIAQGQGNITVANIQQMLGGIDQHWPYKMLIALIKHDSQSLLQFSQEMASYSPSYHRLYAELIQLLHQVALYQVTQQHFDLTPEHAELLKRFSSAMSAEDVQLYYQIALNGRKDLAYAGDEQAAFDMTLLRMLAFKPAHEPAQRVTSEANTRQTAQAVNFDDIQLEATDVSGQRTAVVDESLTSHSKAQLDMPAAHIEPSSDKADDIECLVQKPQEINEADLAEEMLSIEQQAQQLTSEQLQPNHIELNADNTVETTEEEKLRPDDDLFANLSNGEQVDGGENNNQQLIDKPDLVASEPFSEERTAEQEVASLPINDANELQQAVNASQTVEAPTQLPDNKVALSSPIEAALATRNMLRSRKKELEQNAKKPKGAESRQQTNEATNNQGENTAVSSTSVEPEKPAVPELSNIPPQGFSPDVIDPAVIRSANQVDRWANMVDAMALNGRLRQLAIHATIDEKSDDERLILCLNQTTKHLKSDAAHAQLEQFVSDYFNKAMSVELVIVEQTVDDPYQIQGQINDKRYQYAKDVLLADDVVQHFQQAFQAEIDENTIVAL